jgi:single-strand DNA-binding protein
MKMFNDAHISMVGYVATQPQLGQTKTGIPSVRMRVAWTPRWMDRATGEWVDADTSFLTVMTYRKLAENLATCVRKGDPVMVHGRFTIRTYEDKNGAERTVVEVDATSVGHDLTRGVSQFQRVRPQTGLTAAEYQATENGTGGEHALSAAGDGDLDGFASDALAPDEAALARLDETALAGDGGGPGPDGQEQREGDGSPGRMFDDEAVDALSRETAGVAAPF